MGKTRLCAFGAASALVWAAPALAREVPVASASALKAAIADARPGDVLVLAPGTYRTTGESCSAHGTASEPIVVKSASPLAAKLQLDSLEGFRVTGAHWHFEGLDITGVCQRDDDCEHAFHVTGGAVGFVLRDSRVLDFNAQLKVNAVQTADGWSIPHGGLVERNELADSHARATSHPVTKLNIDTGDNWVVRANYLHDAHKAGGDNVSYAAFMKSGGRNGTFERNLVICSRTDTTGGVRIGLSFGGGGTGAQFCAPAFSAAVPCDLEHSGGTMKNNIIVNCSDVGIYLNKAKDSKLLFNTLVATSGIDFRFASSSGEADGNVLAGKIRARDGASFVAKSNLMDVTSFDAWYIAPTAGDLRRKGDLSPLLSKLDPRADLTHDYCGRARVLTKLTLGALEHALGDCETSDPTRVEAPALDGGLPATSSDAGVTLGSDAGHTPTVAHDAGSSVLAPDAMAEAEPLPPPPHGRSDDGCSALGSREPSGWLLCMLAPFFRRMRGDHPKSRSDRR